MKTLLILALLLSLSVPSASHAAQPTTCPTWVRIAGDFYAVAENNPLPTRALGRVWAYLKTVVQVNPEQPHSNNAALWIDPNWIQGSTPCYQPPMPPFSFITAFYTTDNNVGRLWGTVAHELSHVLGAGHGGGNLADAYIWNDLGAIAYARACPADNGLCLGLQRAIWGK